MKQRRIIVKQITKDQFVNVESLSVGITSLSEKDVSAQYALHSVEMYESAMKGKPFIIWQE